MPILWREQMSVSNLMIDDEHKYLICLINALELSIETGARNTSLSFILNQLMQYTKDHFVREEELQLKIGYPHYLENKREHQSLIQQINDINELIVTIERGEETHSQVTTGLVELTRHWLIDHILKTDLKMKPYLEKYPESLSIGAWKPSERPGKDVCIGKTRE